MNIPARINALAYAIIAGDLTAIPATDQPYYSNEEWTDAAQCAVDGDETDLRLMLDIERQHQDYIEWVASARSEREQERRLDLGFQTWRQTRGEESWKKVLGRAPW